MKEKTKKKITIEINIIINGRWIINLAKVFCLFEKWYQRIEYRDFSFHKYLAKFKYNFHYLQAAIAESKFGWSELP